MAKILVTGGLGVLGRKLVLKLRHLENDVWFSDLSHHDDPKYFRCDIGEYRQLRNIFTKHKFDYVYNLAAEFGRWNGEDFYEKLWRTNVVGLKHIIKLQEEFNFKLIHASSSEVYGDYEGVMNEDVMDRHEIKQLNDYAMTKWVNEQQILNSSSQYKTQTVRIRIFNTYGPGEYYSPYRSVVCRFVYSALHHIPYTVYKNHTRTHTYIDDSVEWISKIYSHFKPSEVYNVAGTHRTTIKEISDEILKQLNQSDKNVTYFESEPMTTKDKVVDNNKIKKNLGSISETPFHLGIKNTISWMKEVYKR